MKGHGITGMNVGMIIFQAYNTIYFWCKFEFDDVVQLTIFTNKFPV